MAKKFLFLHLLFLVVSSVFLVGSFFYFFSTSGFDNVIMFMTFLFNVPFFFIFLKRKREGLIKISLLSFIIIFWLLFKLFVSCPIEVMLVCGDWPNSFSCFNTQHPFCVAPPYLYSDIIFFTNLILFAISYFIYKKDNQLK